MISIFYILQKIFVQLLCLCQHYSMLFDSTHPNEISSHYAFPKRLVSSVIFLGIYWLSVGIFFKDIYALVLCPFLNYDACFVDF